MLQILLHNLPRYASWEGSSNSHLPSRYKWPECSASGSPLLPFMWLFRISHPDFRSCPLTLWQILITMCFSVGFGRFESVMMNVAGLLIFDKWSWIYSWSHAVLGIPSWNHPWTRHTDQIYFRSYHMNHESSSEPFSASSASYSFLVIIPSFVSALRNCPCACTHARMSGVVKGEA